MRQLSKVVGLLVLYTLLLAVGLCLSQVLPGQLGESYQSLQLPIKALTMTALAFIMIRAGNEFRVEMRNLLSDYGVAMTAAALPWLFCAAYFIFVMNPPEVRWNLQLWKESLLESRFASPTSAGVLFTMLAAAGLANTWVFGKARVLAILDDFDTIFFLVLLQFLLVGFKWQLVAVLAVMVCLLVTGRLLQHKLPLPRSWSWVLVYAALLMAISEAVLQGSLHLDPETPVHLEVLLPAFVLGWLMVVPGEGAEAQHERRREQAVGLLVSAVFLFLVGLSMPAINFQPQPAAEAAVAAARYGDVGADVIARKNDFPGWTMIALHVAAITVLSNVGKLIPFLPFPIGLGYFRRDAGIRERMALGFSMFPRGEVGAGVLAVSVAYGVSGPTVTVAVLSLALNLLLTWLFILAVRWLVPHYRTESEVLRSVIRRAGTLDYAVYVANAELPDVVKQLDADPKSNPVAALPNRAFVLDQIQGLIGRLSMPGSAVAQVATWDGLVVPAIRILQGMQQKWPADQDWPDWEIRQLILDVEVGGVFVSAVGGRGWVVAASLDQTVMNDDSADRELQQIARGLRRLWHHTAPGAT